MLYVIIGNNGKARAVTPSYAEAMAVQDGGKGTWQNRNDWRTLERAREVAAQLNVATKKCFIPTDAGDYVSPRYDVIELPKVGDQVSYAFNGDSYPDGTIVSISTSLRKIVTSTGSVFWRRRLTGAWVKNGCWSLVAGHTEERNPHF